MTRKEYMKAYRKMYFQAHKKEIYNKIKVKRKKLKAIGITEWGKKSEEQKKKSMGFAKEHGRKRIEMEHIMGIDYRSHRLYEPYEDELIFRRMYAGKLQTLSQIAVRLGRTTAAIHTRLGVLQERYSR